ncbi:hypothetical protein CsSME_00031991 [Camellia sinensis var. sinensis]
MLAFTSFTLKFLQEKPELIPGVHIEIMLEGKKGMEYNTKGSDEQVPLWLSARLLALVDVPVSSIAVESIIQASSGSLEHQWEVGWSLASYIDGPQPLMDTTQAQVSSLSVFLFFFISCVNLFPLGQIHEWKKFLDSLHFREEMERRKLYTLMPSI